MISALVQSVYTEAAKVFLPPPSLTVTEWAERERVLSPEASAEIGRYRVSRAPYQRGMQDAILDPVVEEVVFMTSAQIGKSLCLENIGGYFIDKDPCPIVWMWQTLERAKEWSGNELSAMLRDTPALRNLVPEGARKAGNRALYKGFPGGALFVIGANSPGSLRAKRARIIIADEVDAYPASAGDEGDPVSLVAKRQATFWNRKRVLSSTPTIKGESRIEAAYENSNKQRYQVPCPDCKEFQVLDWKSLQFDRTDVAADDVEYACRHCGVLIAESSKTVMLRDGRWVAERPQVSRVAGFWLSEMYSPFVTWRQMAENYVKALKEMRQRQNPEQMKTFVNLSLGRTWEEQGEEVPAAELLARREVTVAAADGSMILPDGVVLLTAAVDVQRDRLEVEVAGWGKGEERWAIERVRMDGDTSRLVGGDKSSPIAEQRLSPWERLDEFLKRTWWHVRGVRIPIAATFVDSGDQAVLVYGWTGPRNGRRIFACKGVTGWGKPPLSNWTRNNRAKVKLYTVAVDVVKDMTYKRLRIATPGAGFMHYSSTHCDGTGLPIHGDAYFAELTSEKLVREYRHGYTFKSWRLSVAGSRNETLDLHNYTYAAFLSLSSRPDQMLANLREQLLSNAKLAEAERKANPNQMLLVPPVEIAPEAAPEGATASENEDVAAPEVEAVIELTDTPAPPPQKSTFRVRKGWVNNW